MISPKRCYRFDIFLPLACLFMAGAALLSLNVADPDLWGHSRYGTDMIEEGRIIHDDPYSYLSSDNSWVNHELISEFTIAYLENSFGPYALQVWKLCAAALLCFLIMKVHRSLRFEPVPIFVMAVLVLFSMRVGWLVRPQIYTYLLLGFLSVIIVMHDRGCRWPLFLLPFLIAFWTNAHGGFLVGVCIAGFHIVSHIAALLFKKEDGWRAQAGFLAIVLTATTLATFANPYGSELLGWLKASLTQPRPEITEWRSVVIFSKEFMTFKIMVVLGIVVFWKSRLPISWNQAAILAIVAWQSFSHFRHIPLFAILAAFFMPSHVIDCYRVTRLMLRRNQRCFEKRSLNSIKRYYSGAFAVLTLLFLGITLQQLSYIRVYKNMYPVEAFQYIEDHNLQGRMVTEFNWAQYCIYAFGPQIQVSVDGRFRTVYEQTVLDWNFDLTLGEKNRYRHSATGAFDPHKILELKEPNLALIDRNKDLAPKIIREHGAWVLLYQDSLAEVWGRKSIYDEPGGERYIPPLRRAISEKSQVGFVKYPALPIPHSASIAEHTSF